MCAILMQKKALAEKGLDEINYGWKSAKKL
jgi:hypothetical protein